jgi:hypothetical protein
MQFFRRSVADASSTFQRHGRLRIHREQPPKAQLANRNTSKARDNLRASTALTMCS